MHRYVPCIPTRTRARSALAGAVALAAPLLLTPGAGAQQFIVDDAAITPRGACQVEAWWGTAEAWVLPACTFLPATELTVGFAHLDPGTGSRDAHGILEVKSVFRDADRERWGLGFVVGAAIPVDGAGPATSAWAFVPLTVHAEALPATLHLNAGWGFEREDHVSHVHDHHGLAWGARADLELHPRGWLIGELFGLTGDGAEVQVGLRTELLPGRLALDLSWGDALSSGREGLGFQVGLAWTPAPFERGARSARVASPGSPPASLRPTRP